MVVVEVSELEEEVVLPLEEFSLGDADDAVEVSEFPKLVFAVCAELVDAVLESLAEVDVVRIDFTQYTNLLSSF